MIEDIKKDAGQRMEKALSVLQQSLSKLRTGRASVGLLDQIRVEFYGNEVPLNQAATVVTEDARTLMITPWDKDMVPVIEKAIMTSELGLNPNTAGTTIRLVLPPLTEDRRRDLVKVLKADTEQSRVAIRNIRRDANQDVKDLEKEKLINEDEAKRGEQEIQKLTDRFIARADELMAAKERELMSV